MRFIAKTAALCVLAGTLTCRAQKDVVIMGGEVQPGYFAVEYQAFRSNVTGLGLYMDYLKKKDPKVHAQLELKYAKLADDRSTARVILWSSTAAAVGGLTAMALDPKVRKFEFTPIRDLKPATKIGAGVATVGLIGLIYGWVAYPGQKDVLNFINQHNQIRKKYPIQMHLGLVPVPDGFLSTAQVRF